LICKIIIIEEKDRDEQVKAMFKKQRYSSYGKHEKDRVDKLIKEENDEKYFPSMDALYVE
jgi:hypothetical protein